MNKEERALLPELSDRDRFLREIELVAVLPREVKPEDAAVVVMCTLAERLTPAVAHDMFNGLPPSIRPLFQECLQEREGPVIRLNRVELILQIADRLHVTPVHAEVIARAVFRAVKARLPPKQVLEVASQMPKDMADIWLTTRTRIPDLATASAADVRERVLSAIEKRVPLPPAITAEDAFSAVMCTLSQRITGGEAHDVYRGLPVTLRPLIERCTEHRRELPTLFDRDQFRQRLAQHLGTTPTVAEQIARAVISQVKQVLPTKEVHDVASQLPADLRDLWDAT